MIEIHPFPVEFPKNFPTPFFPSFLNLHQKIEFFLFFLFKQYSIKIILKHIILFPVKNSINLSTWTRLQNVTTKKVISSKCHC